MALIAGKPMIQRVIEQCQKAASLCQVIVATDDSRIAELASRFCRVEMTRADHRNGTERIAAVVERYPQMEAVVNIQGDEPMIEPATIDRVARAISLSPMSTAATPIRQADDYENPNVVKVVVNTAGRALYFSRRTIPYLREAATRSVHEQLAAFPFLKHLGIYGYRRETLLELVRFPVSPMEAAEKLEQLRAMENGIPIYVLVESIYDSLTVDVHDDIARIEERLIGKAA